MLSKGNVEIDSSNPYGELSPCKGRTLHGVQIRPSIEAHNGIPVRGDDGKMSDVASQHFMNEVTTHIEEVMMRGGYYTKSLLLQAGINARRHNLTEEEKVELERIIKALSNDNSIIKTPVQVPSLSELKKLANMRKNLDKKIAQSISDTNN